RARPPSCCRTAATPPIGSRPRSSTARCSTSSAEQPDLPEVALHAGMEQVPARGRRQRVRQGRLARLEEARAQRRLRAVDGAREAVARFLGEAGARTYIA